MGSGRLAGLSSICVLSAVLFAPSAVHACGPLIEVNYLETDGDVMTIRNRSEQAWALQSLTFNMTTSRGSIIFDTLYGGPGSNAARDFYVISGNGKLLAPPLVEDGGSVMLMTFTDFGPGREIDFAIDLDDRMPNSIMGTAYVTGEEIMGGEVSGKLRSPEGHEMDVRGVFNEKNVAHLTSPACV